MLKLPKATLKNMNKNIGVTDVMIDQCDFGAHVTNETDGGMDSSPCQSVMVVAVFIKPLDAINGYKRHTPRRRLGLRSLVEKLKAGDQHVKETERRRYDRTPNLTEYDAAVHGLKTVKTWVYEYRDESINAKRSYFIVLNGRLVTVYFGRIGSKHRRFQYMRYTCKQAESLSSLLCAKRTKRKYVLFRTFDFEMVPEEVNDAVQFLETIQEDDEPVEQKTSMEVEEEEEDEGEEEGEREEDCIDDMLDVFNESSDEESGMSGSDEEEGEYDEEGGSSSSMSSVDEEEEY